MYFAKMFFILEKFIRQTQQSCLTGSLKSERKNPSHVQKNIDWSMLSTLGIHRPIEPGSFKKYVICNPPETFLVEEEDAVTTNNLGCFGCAILFSHSVDLM